MPKEHTVLVMIDQQQKKRISSVFKTINLQKDTAGDSNKDFDQGATLDGVHKLKKQQTGNEGKNNIELFSEKKKHVGDLAYAGNNEKPNDVFFKTSGVFIALRNSKGI